MKEFLIEGFKMLVIMLYAMLALFIICITFAPFFGGSWWWLLGIIYWPFATPLMVILMRILDKQLDKLK